MVKPAIMARVCEVFFGKRDRNRACPGEDDCPDWNSAADIDDIGPDGARIGRGHVCFGCELRTTKPPKLVQLDTRFDQAEIDELVADIECFAAQQQAGFPIAAHDVTPLEQELLIYWHACVRSIEREQQRTIARALQLLFR